MKIRGIIRNSRIRLAIVTVFVLFVLNLQQRIAQLDSDVFPLYSLRSLQGLALYMLGYYRGAAFAYRAHHRDVYENYPHSSADEQLKLLLQSNYKTAQTLAKATLEKAPLDMQSLLTISEVALIENRPDDALAATSRILQHDTDQFDALLLSSFAFARKEHYGKAIHRVNLALRHSRVQSRITTFLGTLDSIGILQTLPRDRRPWCLLAQYHRYLRIFDRANIKIVRTLAEKAVETGDHVADAHLALGILHSKKWQTDEALGSFLKAIKAHPMHAEALRWASTTYGTRGDIRNEYKFMKAAHDVSPDDPFYANRLAEILTRKLGDYYQALSVTLNSLQSGAKTSDSYVRLGEIYNLLGIYEDSIRSYRSAISLNAANFDAYIGLGSSFREIGNADEAIRAYNSAIPIRPTAPSPHIGLAHVYHDANRFAEAIAAYERGIALGNNDTVQLIALCGMYSQSSRFDDAVECFKKALRHKPNDVTARKNLADAQKNLALSRTLNPHTK